MYYFLLIILTFTIGFLVGHIGHINSKKNNLKYKQQMDELYKKDIEFWRKESNSFASLLRQSNDRLEFLRKNYLFILKNNPHIKANNDKFLN